MEQTELHRAQSGTESIQLVALDLDDTVLLPDKTISERTKRAIRAVAEQGKHVVLASARPLRSIAAYANELGIEGYIVGLNGAVIATLPEIEVVKVKRLDPDLVRRALALTEDFRPDNTFVEFPLSFAARYEGDDVVQYSSMAGSTPCHIGELDQLDFSDVCKVALRVTNTPFPALERVRADLGDEAHYVIWEGPWSFVEILPPNTTKAEALAWLADHLGVQKKRVLAVGDERNDIEMLSWAGIGVAMGNAHPEVKLVADHVTLPVTEDGCAIALETFAQEKL